ncbi:MAG: hypothetical protein PVI86_19350, partial [Phycisphaerae bacterium]
CQFRPFPACLPVPDRGLGPGCPHDPPGSAVDPVVIGSPFRAELNRDTEGTREKDMATFRFVEEQDVRFLPDFSKLCPRHSPRHGVNAKTAQTWHTLNPTAG